MEKIKNKKFPSKFLVDITVKVVQRYRDSPSATVRDRPPSLTNRYQALPNATVTCVTFIFFYKTLNIYSKHPIYKDRCNKQPRR